jgi:hypothetical protein
MTGKDKVMPSARNNQSMNECRGFATIEYCIVCALVVMVLFASPGTPAMLVDAFKAFYRALTFYISLP